MQKFCFNLAVYITPVSMVPVCVWIDPDEGRVTASGKNKNLAFFFWFKTKMLFSRQSYGSIIILACFVY